MTATTPQPTLELFKQIIAECKTMYLNKTKDYGTSWRIFRLPSLTDQIFIKAFRIRSIEDKGVNKVGDSVRSEYTAIVNYCIIALIQMELKDSKNLFLSLEEASQRYDGVCERLFDLLDKKNHDYDEVWRQMRVTSFVDIILTKLFRIKQIEDNQGVTTVSEGVDGNYFDSINYALFAIIHLDQKN